MKAKQFFGIIMAVSVMGAVPIMAAEHKTPTAPKEYLAMKNPLSLKDRKVIEEGETLYKERCKKCHGEKGDGKGDDVKDMNPRPTAFTDKGYMSKRPDGQLFYISEKGSPKTDMEGFGPGSDTDLPHTDLWKIITYMRTAFGK